jgi:hypothetical protein
MRSTLDYFKLGMHVETTTNLAKLSMKNKRKRSNLKLAKINGKGRNASHLGKTPLGLRLQYFRVDWKNKTLPSERSCLEGVLCM